LARLSARPRRRGLAIFDDHASRGRAIRRVAQTGRTPAARDTRELQRRAEGARDAIRSLGADPLEQLALVVWPTVELRDLDQLERDLDRRLVSAHARDGQC
jgi:hypothetical protein